MSREFVSTDDSYDRCTRPRLTLHSYSKVNGLLEGGRGHTNVSNVAGKGRF